MKVPGAVAVLLVLQAAPASAQRWTMVTSETLTVIGDASPRTLTEVAVEIEQFREIVGSLFRDAGRGPSIPTVVYVFSTRGRMRDFLPVVDGKKAEVAGLMSRDGEINRILMTTEDREASSKIAFHEYTHLLVGNTGRQLPLWLNEGLAEYYSTYHVMDGGRTADIGRTLETSLLYLRERWLPLKELVAVEGAMFHDSGRRDVFYPQAWALVHYVMTQMPGGVMAINNYINAVNAGVSSVPAFEQAFGETIDSVERKLRQYVQRPIFTHARFTFSDKIATRAPSVRTLGAPEADAWLGDLQLAERLREQAVARIESAVSREPGVAMAHIALGRLRAAQERGDEARQALSHAASLAPEDYVVQWSSVMSRLRMGALRDDADALIVLRRITTLRPESAEGLAIFGSVAMRSSDTREQARTALEKAMSLAPGRLDYRLRFAELLMFADQTVAARAVLRPLTAQKTDLATADRASSHLRDIEAFEARRAAATANRQPPAVSEPAASVPATSTVGPPPATPQTGATATTPLRLGSNGAFSTGGADALQQRNRRLLFLLRPVGAGEERTFGRLTQLECHPGGEVRFHLTADGQTMAVGAASMNGVELMQYRDNNQSMLRCGLRNPADLVFVTWRKSAAAQGIAGTAVAVEFLPDDFVP